MIATRMPDNLMVYFHPFPFGLKWVDQATGLETTVGYGSLEDRATVAEELRGDGIVVQLFTERPHYEL